MSRLYNYVKNQWILRRYDVETIALCMTKNYITPAEAEQILAMPQQEVS